MQRMMYVLVVAVSFFGALVYMSLTPAKAGVAGGSGNDGDPDEADGLGTSMPIVLSLA